jgi:hypothetical protein
VIVLKINGDNMKKWTCRAGVIGAAMIVAACGGGTGVSTTTGPGITTLVSFGDSLSDAGTHAVGTVALLAGGRYTINSGDAANPSKIWLDLIAAQEHLLSQRFHRVRHAVVGAPCGRREQTERERERETTCAQSALNRMESLSREPSDLLRFAVPL